MSIVHVVCSVMDFVASSEGSVFCSLLLGGVVSHGVLYWLNYKHANVKESRSQKRDIFEFVGKVKTLYHYPIKACAGFSLSEFDLSSTGAITNGVTDRHFMVTTSNYEYMSQGRAPRMTLILPSIHGPDLHIDAPNMETLIVPKKFPLSNGKVVSCRVLGSDCKGIDCGDAAANWFSKFLNKENLRFVYYDSSLERRPLKHFDEESVGYANYSAYMIATEESLKDINGRLNKKIDIRNFRPNIVIGDTKTPWSEDEWEEIKICETKMKCYQLCTRCKTTTVDPDSGEYDENREPLKTLKSYRSILPGESRPVFGTNMYLVRGGRIHVGADVYARRKKNYHH